MRTINHLCAALLLLLSFSCSKGLNSSNTAEGLIQSSSSSYSAPRSFPSDTGVISSPSPAPSPANPTPPPSGLLPEGPEDKMEMYTGRSPTGPWVLNGKACRGEVSYFKLTKIPTGAKIRGCAAPAPGTACLDYSKHREYSISEWSNGDIITELSVADSNSYPLGQYTFYSSLLGSKKVTIVKVGTASLETCSGVTPPVVKCEWVIQNPRPVIGGGVNHLPNSACTQNGQTGVGYYDMGSGNVEYFDYKCVCK